MSARERTNEFRSRERNFEIAEGRKISKSRDLIDFNCFFFLFQSICQFNGDRVYVLISDEENESARVGRFCELRGIRGRWLVTNADWLSLPPPPRRGRALLTCRSTRLRSLRCTGDAQRVCCPRRGYALKWLDSHAKWQSQARALSASFSVRRCDMPFSISLPRVTSLLLFSVLRQNARYTFRARVRDR